MSKKMVAYFALFYVWFVASIVIFVAASPRIAWIDAAQFLLVMFAIAYLD